MKFLSPNSKIIHSNFISAGIDDSGYVLGVALVRGVKELCREKGYEITRIKSILCYDVRVDDPTDQNNIVARGDYSVAIVQNEKGENEAVVFMGSYVEFLDSEEKSPVKKKPEI
jgi:hypothetical protein